MHIFVKRGELPDITGSRISQTLGQSANHGITNNTQVVKRIFHTR